MARPGRPPRRGTSGPRWPYLALGLLVVLALYGGYDLWRGRQGAADPQARALAATAPAPTAETPPTAVATPASVASPTRPVVAAGSVPGGEAPPSTPLSTGQPAASPATAAPTTAPANAAAGQAPPAPATAVAPAPAPASGQNGFDQATLQKRMLELVNQDRQDNGLRPVEWDDVAATAGQKHTDEMASLGYMSHWDIDGHGPEYRYSQAGGLDLSQENVYRLTYRWEDGSGAPITDWDKVIREAEAALMASPGHRANLLTPEHNRLGVGISYQPESGTVVIAQEFVNRYVTRDPLPQRARPGDRIVLRGKLLPDSTSPLVNIGYEPFPKPMTLEELNNTGTYTPLAKPISAPAVRVDADGSFVAEYRLDAGAQPGLYHVLVGVTVPGAQDKVLAADAVIEVR